MIEKVISHLHQISFIFSQLPLKIVIIAHENDPKKRKMWDEIELEIAKKSGKENKKISYLCCKMNRVDH